MIRFVRSIDREDLLRVYAGHHDFEYINFAVSKTNYLHWIEIDRNFFRDLLLNSDAHYLTLDQPEYPSLQKVISQIRHMPDFLLTPPPHSNYRGLNGLHVKASLEDLESGMDLISDQPPVIVDKTIFPAMTQQNSSHYIIDGMHKLVAYGLWEKTTFPISLYVCSLSDPIDRAY